MCASRILPSGGSSSPRTSPPSASPSPQDPSTSGSSRTGTKPTRYDERSSTISHSCRHYAAVIELGLRPRDGRAPRARRPAAHRRVLLRLARPLAAAARRTPTGSSASTSAKKRAWEPYRCGTCTTSLTASTPGPAGSSTGQPPTICSGLRFDPLTSGKRIALRACERRSRRPSMRAENRFARDVWGGACRRPEEHSGEDLKEGTRS